MIFLIYFLLKPPLFQTDYHAKCKTAEINMSFKFNKCLEIEKWFISVPPIKVPVELVIHAAWRCVEGCNKKE